MSCAVIRTRSTSSAARSRRAALDAGLQRLARTDRRISGRVVTVKLEADDGRPAASRHLGTTAIEAAQPGDVIVIEQRTGIDAASWGGNLSLRRAAARDRGRDRRWPGARHRRGAGLRLSALCAEPDAAHRPRTDRGDRHQRADHRLATSPSSPGDYVVADGTGVVFVAAGEIEAVLEAAEAMAARERAMVAALREGLPVTQVMGKSYETMLKTVSDVTAQSVTTPIWIVPRSSTRRRSATRSIGSASPASA